MIDVVDAATGPDGFLSSRREMHALSVGLAAGAAAALADRPDLLAVVVAISIGVRTVEGPLRELRREPWYACGGSFIGWIIVQWWPLLAVV